MSTTQAAFPTCGGVQTQHFHLAQVDVLPDEHIIRYGDDFVGHVVEIAVQRPCEMASTERFVVGEPQIELVCRLRLELSAAIMGIVALIEVGRPENVLIGEADEKQFVGQQPVGQRKRRRQPPHVGGGLRAPVAIEMERVHQAADGRQPPPSVAESERLQPRIAVRQAVKIPAAVETGMAEVDGIVGRQPIRRLPQHAHVGIVLTLPIAGVVHAVGIIAVHITAFGPIGLGVPLQPPLFARDILVGELGESVAFVKPFTIQIGVIPDDTGQQTVVVIIIQLAVQLPAVGFQHEVHFSMAAVHAAVGASVAHGLSDIADGVGVTVVRVQVVEGCGKGEMRREAVLPTDKRADVAEASGLEFGPERSRAMGLRLLQSVDVQDCDPASVACGDEDVTAIAHRKRDILQVGQRVTRQVYLSALAVAEHDSVITHARMLRSEAPDAHRLHPSRAAIVLQVDAGQAVHGVCKVGNAQALKAFTVEQLHDIAAHHAFSNATTLDDNAVQLVNLAGVDGQSQSSANEQCW